MTAFLGVHRATPQVDREGAALAQSSKDKKMAVPSDASICEDTSHCHRSLAATLDLDCDPTVEGYGFG